MIGRELLRGGSFWSFLLSIDKDLAECTRQKACSCGGRLHCANYPRSPRGGPDDLPEEYNRRYSFCCDRGRNWCQFIFQSISELTPFTVPARAGYVSWIEDVTGVSSFFNR
jgi:hypothetical protein